MSARLKTKYENEIRPALIERFGYSSPMQAPKVMKVTVNMGVGDGKQDSKIFDAAAEQLGQITGQKPNMRRARKSIAQFKLREGMPVGLAVTLRGERQYEFLDRLFSIAMPRIRDFRGVSTRASTVGATTRSAYASRPSSPRSITTRSTRPAVSISRSRPTDALTRSPTLCSRPSACHSRKTAAHRPQHRIREQKWPRPHSESVSSGPPSSRPGATPAAVVAAGPGRFIASSASAGSACASLPTTDTSRA